MQTLSPAAAARRHFDRAAAREPAAHSAFAVWRRAAAMSAVAAARQSAGLRFGLRPPGRLCRESTREQSTTTALLYQCKCKEPRNARAPVALQQLAAPKLASRAKAGLLRQVVYERALDGKQCGLHGAAIHVEDRLLLRGVFHACVDVVHDRIVGVL